MRPVCFLCLSPCVIREMTQSQLCCSARGRGRAGLRSLSASLDIISGQICVSKTKAEEPTVCFTKAKVMLSSWHAGKNHYDPVSEDGQDTNMEEDK